MRKLFVLLFVPPILLPAVIAAVNPPPPDNPPPPNNPHLQRCLESIRSGPIGTAGGRDKHGNFPVDIRTAPTITYESCLAACGAGPGPFQWFPFSQQFSSWLLPWLALLSQLPFGSNDKLDNLDSMLLTIGSPTLAAYSLALTALNGRWIARRFARLTYPNIRHAIRIFNNLQQVPLRIVKDNALLASLVVLPQNDAWWFELDERLNDTHSWSISAIASIAWVVIAYIFTVLDSFTTDPGMPCTQAIGQAVASLWLWLLPIIIGWLMISPKCDSLRLSNMIERANKIAYVATENGNTVILTEQSESEKHAVEFTILEVDLLTRDEKRTAPVYHYAKFLSWVMAVEEVFEAFHGASDHYHDHLSVDPTIDWVTVDRNQRPDGCNRVGNRGQLEEYCRPLRARTTRSRWGPNVISRMVIASFLAMVLQWGTAGSAIIVIWFTPTTGLSCRSASFIIYAVLSTIVWILLVSSSILTHYATMQPLDSRHRHQPFNNWSIRTARLTSIFLRCIGKLIATLNAIWILVSCMLQLSNFYDTCYCNSNVFSLHSRAYAVIQLVVDDLAGMTTARIGGVCLAAGVVVIYVGFVVLHQ